MQEEIDIPEDVLEDLMNTLSEVKEEITGKPRKKAKLPSSREIARAVAEAALRARGANPEEFPEIVKTILEEQGFSTKYVTDKRIWRTYEILVRKGVIPDTLGVVMW